MAETAQPPVQPSVQPSFEQSLGELEQIVRQLEEGQLGLAESLASYELGVKRLKECYQLLERAERRIELLERVDADGEAVTRPFDAAATIDSHALATDGQPIPSKPAPRRAAKPTQADVGERRDVRGRDIDGRDIDGRTPTDAPPTDRAICFEASGSAV